MTWPFLTPQAAAPDGRSQPSRALPRGLTLIELMIVAVIVSILAGLAYPAWREHVHRTHRARAAACLEELALMMERQHSISLDYHSSAALPAAACVTSLADRYELGFAPGEPTANTYTVTAAPKGPQASDTACGTLGLNHQGLRMAQFMAGSNPAPAAPVGSNPASGMVAAPPAPAASSASSAASWAGAVVVQSCWR